MLIAIGNNGFEQRINLNQVTHFSESDAKEFALCFCLTSGERITTGQYRDSNRCDEIIDEITSAYAFGKTIYRLPQA